MGKPVEKAEQNDYKEELIEFKYKFRDSLPKHMSDRSTSSVWAILKQCVDKVSINTVFSSSLSLRLLMIDIRNYIASRYQSFGTNH